MRKLVVLALMVFASVRAAAAAEGVVNDTIFHYAERSFAVGIVSLQKPQSYREGRLMLFPAQIDDLVWAPNKTKPRNLMVAYQVGTDEKDTPPFKEGDSFLAPIRLLPQHSYWRDNLPTTRRHEIAGGRRNAIRGNDIAEAKKILADYLKAHDEAGVNRWTGKIGAVSNALATQVSVLREDALRYLAAYPNLAAHFPSESVPAVATFLKSDAPAADKRTLVNAFATAKVEPIKPLLVELSTHEDATGAAALSGLEVLGDVPPTDRVLAMSRSSSADVRAYAAESLGRRAAGDEAARKRAFELLDDSKESDNVRGAAAAGLGHSSGAPVVEGLAKAVKKGDGTSDAASSALAAIGGPESSAALGKILKEEEGRAALSAVSGLFQMKDCADCGRMLNEQHKSHRDPEVQHLIGVVLGEPLEHKH
jgi:HEAT repeat protein